MTKLTNEEQLQKELRELQARFEESKVETAKLLERVAKLEPVAPVPYTRVLPTDYSQYLSLPKSAMQDLIRNVPDRVCNDLITDAWPSLRK